jgi:hypothetical protein
VNGALDRYVQGVVPREMPAAWGRRRRHPRPAGQAVAARSYALAQNRYAYAKTCTQSCQVYGGAGYRAEVNAVGGPPDRQRVAVLQQATADTRGSCWSPGHRGERHVLGLLGRLPTTRAVRPCPTRAASTRRCPIATTGPRRAGRHDEAPTPDRRPPAAAVTASTASARTAGSVGGRQGRPPQSPSPASSSGRPRPPARLVHRAQRLRRPCRTGDHGVAGGDSGQVPAGPAGRLLGPVRHGRGPARHQLRHGPARRRDRRRPPPTSPPSLSTSPPRPPPGLPHRLPVARRNHPPRP